MCFSFNKSALSEAIITLLRVVDKSQLLWYYCIRKEVRMEKITTSFNLSTDILERLKALAEKEKRSVSNMAEVLILEALKNREDD